MPLRRLRHSSIVEFPTSSPPSAHLLQEFLLLAAMLCRNVMTRVVMQTSISMVGAPMSTASNTSTTSTPRSMRVPVTSIPDRAGNSTSPSAGYIESQPTAQRKDRARQAREWRALR